MSHFSKISVRISNKTTLTNAMAKMGLKLQENMRCRYYYGTKVMPYGARLSESMYDLGFEVKEDGSLEPIADLYGGSVEKVIGRNGCILKANYSKATVEEYVASRGLGLTYVSENKIQVYDPSDSSGATLEVTIKDDGGVTCEAKGFAGQSCERFSDLEKAFGKLEEKEYTHEYYETVPQDMILVQESGEGE